MSGVTINLTKWYHGVLASLPLLMMIGTAIMWVDTRYMHVEMGAKIKQISDGRHIQLQIDILKLRILEYNRIVDSGVTLSAKQNEELGVLRFRLRLLEEEKKDSEGYGDLPQ